MLRRGPELATRQRDEIVRAAIKFCSDPEIADQYDSLIGSNSTSLPVAFTRLYEAVYEYRYPAQARLQKYIRQQIAKRKP